MSRAAPLARLATLAALATVVSGLTVGATRAAHAEVPTTIGFTARLVSDDSGDVVKGDQHVTFSLFAAASGGDSEWTETKDIALEDGLLVVALGETTPLTTDVLDGHTLFLQVTVGETVLEPRIPLASVPYAVRAGDTDTIAGVAIEALQQRITGSCATGTVLTGVNANGTVVCAPDSAGSGDITGVTAGSGLEGGGGAGNVTLGLLSTCTVGQVLKWNGTMWGCAADIDTDTNSGGDITSVSTSGASGLQGGAASGDAALSLLTTCTTGQLLKWNGSAWACAGDLDTGAAGGGDITAVVAGSGLTGGATAGSATLGIDYTVADARWVNATGDQMTGVLDMNQNRVTNRGCAPGYVRVGPGLCIESSDVSGLSFSGCAKRCVTAGTHLCTSSEMRAVLGIGTSVSGGVTLDWIDDQDADNSALYVSSTGSFEDPDAVRSTTTTSGAYCRCCADVE